MAYSVSAIAYCANTFDHYVNNRKEAVADIDWSVVQCVYLMEIEKFMSVLCGNTQGIYIHRHTHKNDLPKTCKSLSDEHVYFLSLSDALTAAQIIAAQLYDNVLYCEGYACLFPEVFTSEESDQYTRKLVTMPGYGVRNITRAFSAGVDGLYLTERADRTYQNAITKVGYYPCVNINAPDQALAFAMYVAHKNMHHAAIEAILRDSSPADMARKYLRCLIYIDDVCQMSSALHATPIEIIHH